LYSAGREDSRCLDVLLCLAFGIFGLEDWIAHAGKGQEEECIIMPGFRNRTKGFLFLKNSVSQVLKFTISLLLCISQSIQSVGW
jgi:hypothetical protein